MSVPEVAPTQQGTDLDPLELLAREDKWWVSGGRALVYAPPFPLHAEAPGFWDAAHYLHFPFEPVFTYALVDEAGRELPLRFAGRRWRPDRTQVRFTGPGLELLETRVMLEDDALVSCLTVRDTSGAARGLHLVAWTAQPVGDGASPANGEAGTATAGLRGGLEGYLRDGAALAAARTLGGARRQALRLAVALTVSGSESYGAYLSEPTANHPRYCLTPFRDKLGPGGLPNEEHLGGVSPAGLLYLGVHRRLDLEPGGGLELTVAASVATGLERAVSQAQAAASHPDPVGAAELAWRRYFADAPVFRCEDPWLERYWYYRLYGLRLNTIRAAEGNYRHPVVCEGVGYFRLPIGYSMPVLIRETRWLRDPALAEGILETALDNQTDLGTFPAHTYRDWKSPHELYHADWGGAVEALHGVHPQGERLEAVYAALAAYAEHFRRERDKENSGLYDIVNQWETGQEYVSRYFVADEQADLWQDMKARLKGVDATVYLYRLFQTLERLAPQVGRPEEVSGWRGAAEASGRALLERCWDREREAFFDLGPDGRRSSTLHATSFYPYLTDLAGPEHLGGLRGHLLSPEEFWTEYPVPTSALTDPYFSPDAEWKGKRHNCPWNGRVWPMTNSHVADVLGRASRLDPALRATTAEFVARFVRMMFEDGDPARPNCFEHYHPFTGRASAYRGVDDYMHSYVLDLLARYLAGVDPDGNRVRVDPFPFGLEFRLSRLLVRGRELTVSYSRADGFRVLVDGREVARGSEPASVELDF